MKTFISASITVLLQLAFAQASFAQAVTAEQTGSVTISENSAFQHVRRLVVAGSFDEALDILEQMKDQDVDQTQVMFLVGQIASLQGRWQDAAIQYRKILADKPDIIRVRLELARALFEVMDDEAAVYHFQMVLADEALEEAVKVKIRQYLSAIRARKKWAFGVSFNISPDTNINAATSVHTMELFGLPFKLSDDARQTSGIGFNARVNGSYTHKINQKFRLEGGVAVNHTEYFQNELFNDTLFMGHAGPVFDVGFNTLRLMATGGHRRFGGEKYSHSWGGQVASHSRLGNRLQLTSAVDVQYQKFLLNDARDGVVTSVVLQTSYFTKKSRVLRGLAGMTWEGARAQEYKSRRIRVGAGYRRELAWGVTMDASLEYAARAFTAPDLLTGTKRHDISASFSLDITKRNLNFYGLVPTVGYSYINNDSNNTLHTFERHRGRAGLTRVF